MTKSEETAEKIILLAYSKANALSFKDVKELFNGKEKEYVATDNMNAILSRYGVFANDIEGNQYYRLNSDGIEFASGGCFSGKEKRDRLAIRKANLSLWFSGIAILISLLTFLFNTVIPLLVCK